jgi:hypothetical protein
MPMAQLVGIFNSSHTPFCYIDPRMWNDIRAKRDLRADVPMDDLAGNEDKSKRIKAGFATLKQKIEAARPDVLIVFGDDQQECFDFTNHPAFGIYVGGEFEGKLPNTEGRGMGGQSDEGVERVTLKGHPELAVKILTGLMERHFDPAFLMDMPKPEKGLGHAIMRPTVTFTNMDIPTIPILLNCYYAPEVTGTRAYEFGKAVGQVLAEDKSDLRVAVIGSGGLWHTPMAKQAYLDEMFDRTELACLEKGDIRGMAKHFDDYRVAGEDASQYSGQRDRRTTGMPGLGGPKGGTRETCNWIAAAAVADGKPSTIVDYVPVYASPVGIGFAYTNLSC